MAPEEQPPEDPRATAEGEVVTEEVVAEPPPRYGVAARLALLWGSLAFGAALLAGLVLAALPPGEDLSVLDTIRIGGLLFFGFNHAAVRMDFPTMDLSELLGPDAGGVPFGVNVSVSLAIALMLGTALAVWLLYRGGRAVAEAAEGRPYHGVLLGATVAMPYAVLSLIASFLFVFRVPIPPDAPFAVGGEVRVGASPLAAFLWPLVLGAVAGIAGGFRAGRERVLPTRYAGRALAVLGGGWRMLIWALAVTFVGLFVLSATNPDTFVEYFRGVGEAGVRGGAALVLFTAFLVPNFMTGLLFLGMGAPIVAGDYLGTGTTVLSLLRWPQDFDSTALEQLGAAAALGGAPQPVITYGPGPIDWFYFVLAPLVGVLIGGRWAARRAGEVSAGSAAAVGALAGVPFALGCLALSVLAGIGFRAELGIPFLGGLIRMGPSLALGTLISLVWGAAGGALGGLLGRTRPTAVETPPPPPTEPPPG